MIKRELYLNKIRGFYDKDLIKVITGIRRCGKSLLLKQIMEELTQNGVEKKQIIYINFEFKDYSFIKNDDDLHEYIKKLIITDKKYYLLFDEIQMIENFERAINSFKASLNVSIFITGSNSNLLSGELATLLSGRYVSFNMYPFSFKEVTLLKPNDNIDKLFEDFITWGSLPQKYDMDDEFQTRTYLHDVFNTIIIKDIINRYSIKDIDLFNKIVEYIFTNPSQIFSAENLTKYLLNNDNKEVSNKTIYNYLEYMKHAFLINKVDRYDVRGKRILNGKYKYYLTDLGLGQILNSSKKRQNGAYLENIVYNELLIRGYDVKIGTLINGEIDFIATKFDKKIYIQVAYILTDENVINREFGAFDNINDNYDKYVLTLDTLNFSQNGVIHKNVIDWLLEEELY